MRRAQISLPVQPPFTEVDAPTSSRQVVLKRQQRCTNGFLQRRQHLRPECQRRLPALLALKLGGGGAGGWGWGVYSNMQAVYNGAPALDVTLSQEIARITPESKGTEEDRRQTLQSPAFHMEKQSWLSAWAALLVQPPVQLPLL